MIGREGISWEPSKAASPRFPNNDQKALFKSILPRRSPRASMVQKPIVDLVIEVTAA